MIDDERISVAISVPLIFEYEHAVKNNIAGIRLSSREIEAILDYICLIAEKRRIFYLWRPYLRDPKDDMELELAVESECEFIITFNKRDFAGTKEFGIEAVTPKEFLSIIGEKT